MKNFITKKTHERLINELKRLREKDMVQISREKLECAEQGDLRENFGYAEAKKKLEMIQNRINDLNALLSTAQFIDDLPIPGTMVSIGTSVTLIDLKENKEEQYHILGPADSDVEKDIISFETPLAKGLITKKEGAIVDIPLPNGAKKVKILKIEKYRFEE